MLEVTRAAHIGDRDEAQAGVFDDAALEGFRHNYLDAFAELSSSGVIRCHRDSLSKPH